MADIYDEMQDDLRAERARVLARRYGGLAAVLLCLVVLGVGGWQYRQWRQDQRAAATAAIYLEGLRAADMPGGDRALALQRFDMAAARGPEGYRELARLRAAALQADRGDLAAALLLWDQVARDRRADRLLRGLATLLWAQHQVDHGDPAAVTARLRTLTAPDDPWRPLARETQALLALRLGQNAAAIDILRELAGDVTAPEGVRGRANGLLQALGAAPPGTG